MKIAVYGKGGIGKSTISANVSAALAEEGLSVLQIGCDPKHDSTRLLLGGKIPITALQYIKTVLPAERRSEDIVYQGYGDVACVEAGGPEPGVGCAGRGIITTFDLLDELGIRSSLFDITLYDVLGDVVCGGFAVPIRNEYADAVYIVTSGEFLSLYAANNILKGIRNFTEKGDRIAGIIFNARGGQEEDDHVKRFADAVALPVVIRIPRSNAFSRAEEEGCTLIEGYPGIPETGLFRELALHISSIRQCGSELLYPALPLQDDELERIVLLRNDTRPVNKYILSNRDKIADTCVSCSVKNKRPLIGCAFLGAVSVTTMVTDAATVMHCPRSCAMRNYDRLVHMEQRAAEYYDHPYNPDLKKKFVTTDLSDEDFIFGGEKKLSDALESTIKNGFKTIFIITACPPGIIGDDVDKVAAHIREQHPDVQVISVFVDGNLTGDGVQGRMDAYRAIISLIKPGISQYHDRRVNIVGNYFFEREFQDRGKKNRFMRWRTLPRKKFDSNPWTISAIFDLFGITVNCHFLYRTDVNSLTHFNDACLNLLVTMNDTMAGIKKMLGTVSHVPFLQHSFPSGFDETKKWVTDLAAVFCEEEKALQVISQAEPEYRKMIERIKPNLQGKTVLISTYPHKIDWICDIACDLGMVIVQIGLGYSAFSEYFTTRYADTIPIIHDYTMEMRSEDIQSLQPDLVLYDYPVLNAENRVKSARIPYNPGFGFFAAVDHAEQWARLMEYGLTEGWRLDGEGIR